MLGWQTVSVTLDNIPLDKAKMVFRQERFVIKEEGEHYAILRRKGSDFNFEGRKVSLEAAIVEEGNNIRFQLRYDTFVLFDTGDLKKELNSIANKIVSFVNKTYDPVHIFKVLGDEKRLGALKLLITKSRYNSELSKLLGLKPTTMSHHMAKLMEIGVVSVRQGDQNKSMYVFEKTVLKKLLDQSYELLVDENGEN